MKKLFLLLFAYCGIIQGFAQDVPKIQDKVEIARDSNVQDNKVSEPVTPEAEQQEVFKLKNKDEILPKYCIDFNIGYGSMQQHLGMVNLLNAYQTTYNNELYKPIIPNSSIPSPHTVLGNSLSGNLQFGYFFGKEHIIGLGIGIIGQYQEGNIYEDPFQIQYARTDDSGRLYRQEITAHNTITEKFTSINASIPILVKFRHQFPKSNFGISADVGAMVNVSSTTNYNTNALFDYEAVYELSGSQGNIKSGYDVSPTPAQSDFLITAQQYSNENHGNTSGEAAYFKALLAQGFNVGLNVPPSKNSGTTHYNAISWGLVAQPSVSYYLSYRVTLLVGGFVTYQEFNNTGNSKYRITDSITSYSSLLNGVAKNTAITYGGSIGVRFNLGQNKDIDGDGTPDKDDDCPYQAGPKIYNGCPDADGDGIPDQEDDCPFEAGPACTNGCPDRDGDCVADKDDLCPDIAGPVELYGCPDSSHFFMARADSNSEVYKYRFQYEYTEATHHIMLSQSVVNFKSGQYFIDESSMEVLDEAVDSLKKIDNLENDEKVLVYISGHTDNVGGDEPNDELSVKRAEAVKRYLIRKGVKRNRIIISGYGKKEPVIDNDTPKHRAKNRRIEIKLLRQI